MLSVAISGTGSDDILFQNGDNFPASGTWRVKLKPASSDLITGNDILSNSISAAHLQSSSVTFNKLATNAVTEGAILDGAVTDSKLGSNIANRSGVSSTTQLDTLSIGGVDYGIVSVHRTATQVNLDGTAGASGYVIGTFDTSDAGVVPSPSGTMTPNWTQINAGTFAVTEDLAYNTSLVTNGGRGWIKINGSTTTTLTEGTTTWQDLLFASGNNINDDQVRFDDNNFSANVISSITTDTSGRGTFVIVCDHNNWAIVDYNDGAGDVFGQTGTSYSYAQSGRTGGTADGTIITSQGMPRSHARIYLPFNAVSGASVTNLVIDAGSDDQYLAASGNFIEAHNIDLTDPAEFVQEVDSTVAQTIHRDTDGNVLRVVKQIRFSDFRQDVTVVFVRTSGQVTSVTYNHGDWGASNTIPAAHLVATKTITRTSGSVSSVSIA